MFERCPWTDSDVASSLSVLGEEAEAKSNITDVHAGLVSLQRFIQAEERGFRDMWAQLSIPNRKKLIRTSNTHIRTSLHDLRCSCGHACDLRSQVLLILELILDKLVGESGEPEIWPAAAISQPEESAEAPEPAGERVGTGSNQRSESGEKLEGKEKTGSAWPGRFQARRSWEGSGGRGRDGEARRRMTVALGLGDGVA